MYYVIICCSLRSALPKGVIWVLLVLASGYFSVQAFILIVSPFLLEVSQEQ